MKPSITISRTSGLYITPPWKMSSKNMFYNQVLEVSTRLKPQDLLLELLDIEKEIGRVRGDSGLYEDRLIDIDILLFSDFLVEDDALVIPQRNIENRAFALLPLLELAPELRDPRNGEYFKNRLSFLQKEISEINKLA